MASKIKASPQKQEATKGRPVNPPDRSVLDHPNAAVEELIRSAKKYGYVTVEQINSVLPSNETASEQISDILSIFGEMGVNVVDTKDAESEEEAASPEKSEEEAEGDNDLVEVQQRPLLAKSAKEPSERADDPVRLYLREMGSVELLSREGEIAIAKRIEAGREAMIAGLCESPLTFQAIVIWRDELNEGKVSLRDIIDLDATYAGPDAKALPAPVIAPTARWSPAPPTRANPDNRRKCRRRPRRPRPPSRSMRPANTPPVSGRRPTERSETATSTTTTIWRIGSRSPQSRRSSSPR